MTAWLGDGRKVLMGSATALAFSGTAALPTSTCPGTIFTPFRPAPAMPSRALLALVLAALAAPFAPAQPGPERHSEGRLFGPDRAPAARRGLPLPRRPAAPGLGPAPP